MQGGKYLSRRPSGRERICRRRLWRLAEPILGELWLGGLWALGYIHPLPAAIMMALLSGRLGFRLGRYAKKGA